MIEIITYICLCLLAIAVLGVPAGMLYKRILWSLSGEDPKFEEYFVGFIPLVNMYAIAKRVTEKYKICWWLLSLLWVTLLVRLCSFALVNVMPMLIAYSALGMAVGIVVTVLMHIIIMAICTYTLDGNWFHYVLCIIPPFAEYVQALRIISITKKRECSELS